MNNFKTVLIYVLAAVILFGMSTLFTVDGDSDLAANFEITDTPTPYIPPTATPLPPTRVKITSGPDGCITTPFGGHEGYRPNAPFLNDLTTPEMEGERLKISGQVFYSDCKTPLPGAMIEIWHPTLEGSYEQSDFRARLMTDENGHYEFKTIKPLPVESRAFLTPARIHYRVSYPDAPMLATQIFFEGDAVLKRKVISSVQRQLVHSLTQTIELGEPLLTTTFDITLMVEPPEAE